MRAVLRHGDVGGQRRPADACERSTASSRCARDAKRRSDAPGGLELAHVPLAVADAQRVRARSPRPSSIAAAVYESRPPDRRTTARRSLIARRSVLHSSLHFALALRTLHFFRLPGLRAPRCTCAPGAARGPEGDRPGPIRSASSGRARRAPARRAPRRPCRAGRGAQDVARVLVVGAVLDDELHFVVGVQAIEVLPVHPVRLSAARALHVHDLDDAGRHVGDSIDGRQSR